MDEIKNAISIMRVRWLEVGFFIGIGVYLSFQQDMFTGTGFDNITPLMLLAFAALMIFFGIIQIGFQRTIHLSPETPQSPLGLFQAGKPFFWRMVGFGLSYMLAILLVAIAIQQVAKAVFLTDSTLPATDQWHSGLWGTIAMALLYKFILLVPAIILVTDCGILQSCRMSAKLRFLQSGPLLGVAIVQLLSGFLLPLIIPTVNTKGLSQYLSAGFPSLITSFLGIILMILTIRFVKAHDLVYNVPLNKPESP